MSTSKKEIKILVLGNPGVGKNTFIGQGSYKKFTGVADWLTRRLSVEGKLRTVKLWNGSQGGERFSSLGNRAEFYKSFDGCILLYDITSTNSFSALESWKNEFCILRGIKDVTRYPLLIVGNKLDLEVQRTVQYHEAAEWCLQNGNLSFQEISANSSPVDPILEEIIRSVDILDQESLKINQEKTCKCLIF
ncbi:Rab7 [Blepharisma stoltei]|uniref:Uncharacterized protein n=1 Tax=Blepharisma stoltei TaxID=1481888 RepID=A0AAU9J9H9_9CILI|nr:unnamed protein product [Blepharisma stoltei]